MQEATAGAVATVIQSSHIVRRKARQATDNQFSPAAHDGPDHDAHAAASESAGQSPAHSIATLNVLSQPAPSPVEQSTISPVQAKLEISEPDDPDEREADRVADRVMRGDAVRRKESNSSTPQVSPRVTSVIADAGTPLD